MSFVSVGIVHVLPILRFWAHNGLMCETFRVLFSYQTPPVIFCNKNVWAILGHFVRMVVNDRSP